ncbi:hypothetical protein IWQ60_004286 [Tieghemiomyces parasiticus]|uniref:Uncharacterized protein n=1 Tax=Tieghemiomyces parasiticus TaxID=78921 RepID=A0A9W8AGH3_9FUNG|nr:hypothetical protein IWQ60_004286 [Tieghemiomyces parasiticus]
MPALRLDPNLYPARYGIIRTEKVRGLYKGMASPLASVAVVNAIIFGVYETTLGLQTRHQEIAPTLDQVFIAGLATGVVSSLITCPTELAKVRLQNQVTEAVGIPAGRTLYRGPYDVFLRTFREGGVRACYRGFVPTLLRELSLGPYFVSYEIYCRWLTAPDGDIDHLGPGALVMAGGLAGITAWLTTYPIDVIKTRVQDQDATTSRQGMLATARGCYREAGVRIFFRGLTATILRAFPCNAATFFVYATSMRLMSRYSNGADQATYAAID